MENQTLSQEQKIDYIYETLKKKEKTEKINTYIKWGFRVFLLIYLVYFYKFALPTMMDSLKSIIKPEININQSDAFDKIQEYLRK